MTLFAAESLLIKNWLEHGICKNKWDAITRFIRKHYCPIGKIICHGSTGALLCRVSRPRAAGPYLPNQRSIPAANRAAIARLNTAILRGVQ